MFFFIPKTETDLPKYFIIDNLSDEKQKYWVGEKYKIIFKNITNIKNNKFFLKTLNNHAVLLKNNIIMKTSGKECLLVYAKKINYEICFNIYNTPEITFKENDPLKIEINTTKILNLDMKDYPELYINYKSDHPDIIAIEKNGKITAIRPGNAIISASGLDNKNKTIKVFAISNNGFLNNNTLIEYNAKFYNNLMIVSHPDDEVLWGGANLFKDKYFVVCLTNGYNLARANDFKKILKFTKNGGIILNYPDVQDDIRDKWLYVGNGIIKDMLTLISYKNWDKIITHGPDGTTGNYHHKKTCEFVTSIVKKLNKLNILYYFGKFYEKNNIPKTLNRISDEDLEHKIKEVSIYKSVKKTIYKLWYHMLPFENWILATKFENKLRI